MAGLDQRDFNRSALTVRSKQAWYTGQRAERIPGGLIKLVGADCSSLDLSYNELTSITGLKHFVKLEELILDNNNLQDLRTLPSVPTLTTLSLNNNKVLDIDAALERIRECCPHVRYVSLLGNSGYPDQLTNPNSNDEADYERYRRYAIHVLPASLNFLDSRPVTREERQEARNRGQFLRTVRLTLQSPPDLVPRRPVDEFDAVTWNDDYSPLPQVLRTPQDHKGAYGKCMYRYSGKNSEGNRFICNNDL